MDNIQDMVRLLKTNPMEFQKLFNGVSRQDIDKVMAALQSIIDNNTLVVPNPTASRHLPMGWKKGKGRTRKNRKTNRKTVY